MSRVSQNYTTPAKRAKRDDASEAIHSLTKALSTALADFAINDLGRMLRAAYELGLNEPDTARAKALISAGRLAREQGPLWTAGALHVAGARGFEECTTEYLTRLS